MSLSTDSAQPGTPGGKRCGLLVFLAVVLGLVGGAVVYKLLFTEDRDPSDPVWCESLGEYVRNPNECPREVDGIEVTLNPVLVRARGLINPAVYTVTGQLEVVTGDTLGLLTVRVLDAAGGIVPLSPGNGLQVRLQDGAIADWYQVHEGSLYGYLIGKDPGVTEAWFEITGMPQDRKRAANKYRTVARFEKIPVRVLPRNP